MNSAQQFPLNNFEKDIDAGKKEQTCLKKVDRDHRPEGDIHMSQGLQPQPSAQADPFINLLLHKRYYLSKKIC